MCTGSEFHPYREQFRKILTSGKVHFLETYNASEGFFGIQDRQNADDMLLMLDYGIYYEFIPDDDNGYDPSRIISLNEVRQGINYAIVISTNGGLWRYVLGDTVKFTSVKPYRIQVTGRTRNFINAFGEELIVENAEKAIAIACQRCNVMVNEFTAAPVIIMIKMAHMNGL